MAKTTSGKPDQTGARKSAKKKSATGGLLDELHAEEAQAVLQRLLEQHTELRTEAEKIAKELVTEPSTEDIAAEVSSSIALIDMEDLNNRAGSHADGYVEPSQAAWDLFEEAVNEYIEDMKRKAKLGLMAAAETVCVGIVEGLYQAKEEASGDVLGWAEDFPLEEAGFAVDELLRSCPAKERKATLARVVETLIPRVPEWEDMLRNIKMKPH